MGYVVDGFVEGEAVVDANVCDEAEVQEMQSCGTSAGPADSKSSVRSSCEIDCVDCELRYVEAGEEGDGSNPVVPVEELILDEVPGPLALRLCSMATVKVARDWPNGPSRT